MYVEESDSKQEPSAAGFSKQNFPILPAGHDVDGKVRISRKNVPTSETVVMAVKRTGDECMDRVVTQIRNHAAEGRYVVSFSNTPAHIDDPPSALRATTAPTGFISAASMGQLKEIIFEYVEHSMNPFFASTKFDPSMMTKLGFVSICADRNFGFSVRDLLRDISTQCAEYHIIGVVNSTNSCHRFQPPPELVPSNGTRRRGRKKKDTLCLNVSQVFLLLLGFVNMIRAGLIDVNRS